MTGGSDRSRKPELASTVILAREQDEELQVYLLKRSARMDFFPGTYVFPGGAVDPEDLTPGLWESHLDVDFESVSQRFGSGGLTGEEALAHGVAAIRETFEEAGVFLAYRNEQSRGDLQRICAMRATKGLRRGWLRERVVSEGWILAFSRLARWAHWITPQLLSRRYDTRFFLAFMPTGQECMPDSRETTHGIPCTIRK
jgi:8-oxo-dGTP pyrophosphatase MutT (NUDIX family)